MSIHIAYKDSLRPVDDLLMEAFVTGGTGFIGANLVAGLNERGIKARVLLRKNSSVRALEGLLYEPVSGDIMNSPEELAKSIAGCDWLFHVAAVSKYWRTGKEQIYKINVKGTTNMLTAANLAGVKRFVFTSSIAALGVPEIDAKLSEKNQFNVDPNRFPYGHSKHLAELEVRKAVDQGLEAVIVNPSIVLGPRDINLISGSIVTEAAKGTGWFYPPGGVNYVDVKDVVNGHIAAAEKGKVGERYILSGHNLSFQESWSVVCEIVGRPPPRVPLPAQLVPAIAIGVDVVNRLLGGRLPFEGDQVRISRFKLYVDGSKAAREFQIVPRPFRETVQDTYDWYLVNGFL